LTLKELFLANNLVLFEKIQTLSKKGGGIEKRGGVNAAGRSNGASQETGQERGSICL